MEEQFKEIKNLIKQNPTMRNIYLALIALIVMLSITLVILVLAPDEERVSRVAEVRITKDGFVPSTLVTEAGTRVVWINTTDSLHQVVSNPHASHESLPTLKSELLNNDQIYEYTFDTPGTFNYHDEIKPTLNGTIKVQ